MISRADQTIVHHLICPPGLSRLISLKAIPVPALPTTVTLLFSTPLNRDQPEHPKQTRLFINHSRAFLHFAVQPRRTGPVGGADGPRRRERSPGRGPWWAPIPAAWTVLAKAVFRG